MTDLPFDPKELVQAAGDAIIAAGADGAIVFWNPAAERRILGETERAFAMPAQGGLALTDKVHVVADRPSKGAAGRRRAGQGRPFAGRRAGVPSVMATGRAG
jgi:hypothetical protein